MKVSVAMAVYNGEKYILKQLSSILSQTLSVDEVIISDDASTDNTANIVRQFILDNSLDGKWKLISNTEKGVKGNFYNAIKSTSGDIVFLCDQDDIWYPEKVEKTVQVFENNADIKCINSSFVYIDGEDNIIPTEFSGNTANNNLILHSIPENKAEKINLPLVINKNISPGMTMAVKREVIDLWLKFTEKKQLHDWEINCLSATVDGLYFYNTPLTYYRIHNNQTVSIGNIKKRTIKDILKAKTEGAKTSICDLKDIIAMCSKTENNTEYLTELNDLCNVRLKVVCGKISSIPKELFKFIKMIIRYGGKRKNLDFRYFIIDIISAFIN